VETIIHKDRESWNFLLHNTFALSVKIVASCVLRYLQIAILCDHNIVVTCAFPCIGVAAENPE
jgi:hypothetical protein